MRGKIPVYARTLGRAVFYRMGGKTRVQLILEEAWGTESIRGREAFVSLTTGEVAGVLAAIPASMLEPEDMKPLMHVMELLHRLSAGSNTQGERGEDLS